MLTPMRRGSVKLRCSIRQPFEPIPWHETRREHDLGQTYVLPVRPVLIIDLEFRPKIWKVKRAR